MKNSFSIFVIFVLLLIGFQSIYGQEAVNKYDANGKRTGVWEKYYNNKRIRYQGQFQEGKEIGIFRYYSSSSSEYPIAIKTFKKNSNESAIKFFTEKGVLESEGTMIGKKREGKWMYYHIDGESILSEENYIDDILNGVSITYYFNGKTTEILHYKNGKLHGELKRYADNGFLLDDLNYEKGKLHGDAKYYNIEGKLIYWGAYENDEKVGEWEYFENGKTVNTDILKQ